VSCCTYGEMRNAYKILVGRSKGSRPLGRSQLILADDIKQLCQYAECLRMLRIILKWKEEVFFFTACDVKEVSYDLVRTQPYTDQCSHTPTLCFISS
jgi:hypothetical protein